MRVHRILRIPLTKLREQRVMRDEQTHTLERGDNVVEDGVRDGDAIVRTGSAAELVEDHEAAVRGLLEDVAGLVQLHHEGGLARHHVVERAHPREHRVQHAYPRRGGGDVAAHLGHYGYQRHLAYE